MAIPKKFQDLVKSFYGCTGGNIFSPVWLCGLEWGGGYDASEPILVDGLKPYYFDDLHCFTVNEFRDSFWAPGSAFCRNVIKILMATQEGTYSGSYTSNFDDLSKRKIVGPYGLALILNTFPISMKGRNVATKSWDEYKVRLEDGSVKSLKDWSELSSFYEYSDYVINNRSAIFTQERIKRLPRLIVCFGNEKYLKLWGGDSKLAAGHIRSLDNGESDCSFYWLSNGEGKPRTLLLITPFPSGPYGLTKDIQFKNVFEKVNELCVAEFGSNWLGQYALSEVEDLGQSQDSESVQSDIKTFGNNATMLKQISDYKWSVNKQLTAMDNISESFSTVLSFNANTEGYEEIFQNYQVNLMRDLHKFDELERKLMETNKEIRSQLLSIRRTENKL